MGAMKTESPVSMKTKIPVTLCSLEKGEYSIYDISQCTIELFEGFIKNQLGSNALSAVSLLNCK